MSARETYLAWREMCGGGLLAANEFQCVAGRFLLDPHPKALKNGALVGSIARVEIGRGVFEHGLFKIAADGSIVDLPDDLRGVLPIATGAATSAVILLPPPADEEAAPAATL